MNFDLITIGLIGSSLVLLRKVPEILYKGILYQFTRGLMVTSRDEAFSDICLWIRKYVRQPKTFRVERQEDHLQFGPGFGWHWFRDVSGVWVSFLRENKSENGQLFETITIRFWTRKLKPVEDLLAEIQRRDELVVNHARQGWFETVRRIGRPMKTVFLPFKERILNDCREFFKSREWFAENGVPWRKAFLFHGPPRTGKTSLIHALATELGLPIYSINPCGLKELEFAVCMNRIPVGALVLLEDIELGQEVSLSTVLNTLDGLAAPVGVVIFATTNDLTVLPENLLDRFQMVEFERVNPEQLSEQQRKAFAAGQNKFGLSEYQS